MESNEKQNSTTTKVQQDIEHFKEQYLHSLGHNLSRASTSSPSSSLVFMRRDSLSSVGTRRDSLSSSSSQEDSTLVTPSSTREDCFLWELSRSDLHSSRSARAGKLGINESSSSQGSSADRSTAQLACPDLSDRDRLKLEYIKSLGLSHRPARPKGLPCLKDRVSEFETLMSKSTSSIPREAQTTCSRNTGRPVNICHRSPTTHFKHDQFSHISQLSSKQPSADDYRSEAEESYKCSTLSHVSHPGRECISTSTDNQRNIPSFNDLYRETLPESDQSSQKDNVSFLSQSLLSSSSLPVPTEGCNPSPGVDKRTRVERALSLGSRREMFEKRSVNLSPSCEVPKNKLTDLTVGQSVIHKAYTEKEKAFILESFRKSGGRQQRTLSVGSVISLQTESFSHDPTCTSSQPIGLPDKTAHSVNKIVSRFEGISYSEQKDKTVPEESGDKLVKGDNYDKRVDFLHNELGKTGDEHVESSLFRSAVPDCVQPANSHSILGDLICSDTSLSENDMAGENTCSETVSKNSFSMEMEMNRTGGIASSVAVSDTDFSTLQEINVNGEIASGEVVTDSDFSTGQEINVPGEVTSGEVILGTVEQENNRTREFTSDEIVLGTLEQEVNRTREFTSDEIVLGTLEQEVNRTREFTSDEIVLGTLEQEVNRTREFTSDEIVLGTVEQVVNRTGELTSDEIVLGTLEQEVNRTREFTSDEIVLGTMEGEVNRTGEFTSDEIVLGTVEQEVNRTREFTSKEILLGTVEQEVNRTGEFTSDEIVLGTMEQEVNRTREFTSEEIVLGTVEQEVNRTGKFTSDVIVLGTVEQEVNRTGEFTSDKVVLSIAEEFTSDEIVLESDLGTCLQDKEENVWLDKREEICREGKLNRISHNREGSVQLFPAVSDNSELILSDLHIESADAHESGVTGNHLDYFLSQNSRYMDNMAGSTTSEDKYGNSVISVEMIENSYSGRHDIRDKCASNYKYIDTNPDSSVLKESQDLLDAAININVEIPQTRINMGESCNSCDANHGHSETSSSSFVEGNSPCSECEQEIYSGSHSRNIVSPFLWETAVDVCNTPASASGFVEMFGCCDGSNDENRSKNSGSLGGAFALSTQATRHEEGNLIEAVNRLPEVNVSSRHSDTCSRSREPPDLPGCNDDEGGAGNEEMVDNVGSDEGNRECNTNGDNTNVEQTACTESVLGDVCADKHDDDRCLLYDQVDGKMLKGISVEENILDIATVLYEPSGQQAEIISLNNESVRDVLFSQQQDISKFSWTGICSKPEELSIELIHDDHGLHRKHDETKVYCPFSDFLPEYSACSESTRLRLALENYVERTHLVDYEEDLQKVTNKDLNLEDAGADMPIHEACKGVDIGACLIQNMGCSGEMITHEESSADHGFVVMCDRDPHFLCNSHNTDSEVTENSTFSEYSSTSACLFNDVDMFVQSAGCEYNQQESESEDMGKEKCGRELSRNDCVVEAVTSNIETYVTSLVDCAMRACESDCCVFSRSHANVITESCEHCQTTCLETPAESNNVPEVAPQLRTPQSDVVRALAVANTQIGGAALVLRDNFEAAGGSFCSDYINLGSCQCISGCGNSLTGDEAVGEDGVDMNTCLSMKDGLQVSLLGKCEQYKSVQDLDNGVAADNIITAETLGNLPVPETGVFCVRRSYSEISGSVDSFYSGISEAAESFHSADDKDIFEDTRKATCRFIINDCATSAEVEVSAQVSVNGRYNNRELANPWAHLEQSQLKTCSKDTMENITEMSDFRETSAHMGDGYDVCQNESSAPVVLDGHFMKNTDCHEKWFSESDPSTDFMNQDLTGQNVLVTAVAGCARAIQDGGGDFCEKDEDYISHSNNIVDRFDQEYSVFSSLEDTEECTLEQNSALDNSQRNVDTQERTETLSPECINVDNLPGHELDCNFPDEAESDVHYMEETLDNLRHEDDNNAKELRQTPVTMELFGEDCVQDSDKVFGEDCVHDSDKVFGEDCVQDSDKVFGEDCVQDSDKVFGEDCVQDSDKVFGEDCVQDSDKVFGEDCVQDSDKVLGHQLAESNNWLPSVQGSCDKQSALQFVETFSGTTESVRTFDQSGQEDANLSDTFTHCSNDSDGSVVADSEEPHLEFSMVTEKCPDCVVPRACDVCSEADVMFTECYGDHLTVQTSIECFKDMHDAEDCILVVPQTAYPQVVNDITYDSNTESVEEGAESMDRDSLEEDVEEEDVGRQTTTDKSANSEHSSPVFSHYLESQNDSPPLCSISFVPKEESELTELIAGTDSSRDHVFAAAVDHPMTLGTSPVQKQGPSISSLRGPTSKIKEKRWKEAEDAAASGNPSIKSPRKINAPKHLDLASTDMTEVVQADRKEVMESPGSSLHRISSTGAFQPIQTDGSRLDPYRFLERSQSDASLLKRDLEIMATDDDVHLTAAESSSGQNISECNRVYLDLSRAEAFERVELGENAGAMMRTSSGRLLETIPQDEELKTGDLSYVYASHRSFSQESSSSMEDLTFSTKNKSKDCAKYKSCGKASQDNSITGSKSNLRSSFQIYSHSLKQKVRQLQMGSVPEQLNALGELNVLMEQAWSMPIYGKDLAYELCDILRTESALDIIVSNLASNNRELMKVSARLLEQSLTTSNRRQVAENGLEMVVKMTHDARGDCELAQICTGILESLFKTSEDTCAKVIKLGGLDTITYWCRCNDRVTLKNCAIALSNLALYGGGENQQEMAKHKVPEWLFPLAFVEDDSVRYYALLAIGVMVSNKEIENAVTSSGTLALVLPFIDSHDPAEFAERDTSHRHGRSPGWLKRLIPVLSSKREEAQALAAFHFVMEAGIKSEQGRKEVLYKIGAVDPLKWLASTPNRVASKLAAQALKIIGEEIPHKLSQQVPLWTCDDVVHWIAQVGFGTYADKFKSCHVDGDLLLRLTEEELRDSLNMSCAITRKRFLRELRDLKISSDYTSCDPSMLGAWLQEVGEDMSQYTYQMLNQGVDKPLLRSLTDSLLVNDCKIFNGIHRMKILSKIEELRSTVTSPSCPRFDSIDAISATHNPPRTPIDVFISYRRSNGSQLASLLKVHLQLRGFTVFIDIEKLRAGKFDESLLESVRQAKNFIIVLTQNSLDRCMGDDDKKDWVHREITAAMEAGSNIIPLLDNFKWPSPESLPEDMRGICYFNAVRWIHDYQDACVDKLEQFLRGETNPQQRHPVSTASCNNNTGYAMQTSGFESPNSPPYQRAQGMRKMSSVESPVDSS